MGLNKRHLSNKLIIETYRTNGIAGLEELTNKVDLLSAEAGIGTTFVTLLNSDFIDDIERWNTISYEVSLASIKEWNTE